MASSLMHDMALAATAHTTMTTAHHWNKDFLMATRAEIEVSDSEEEAVEGFWD